MGKHHAEWMDAATTVAAILESVGTRVSLDKPKRAGHIVIRHDNGRRTTMRNDGDTRSMLATDLEAHMRSRDTFHRDSILSGVGHNELSAVRAYLREVL